MMMNTYCIQLVRHGGVLEMEKQERPAGDGSWRWAPRAIRSTSRRITNVQSIFLPLLLILSIFII